MDLQVLSAADVVASLPMAEAIGGMKYAFAQLSTGRAEAPLRTHVATKNIGSTLVMPAFLADSGDLAVKVVSVFPNNSQLGLPTIHALVLALDAEIGKPLALLEGSSLTAIRTGAVSGAATDLLARQDAQIVAIFGSGVQARTQLEAVCTVRDIQEVRVFSLLPAQAGQFAREMAGRGPIPPAITVAKDANSAVKDADIICTATTSSTPVFDGQYLKPGAHVNGVGSFTPQMQENDLQTVKRSLVIVDSRAAALQEAGDLIIPLRAGDITPEHIAAELGELVAGIYPGRTSSSQITFFKSVGIAVQDAAAASIAISNARANGLGSTITL
ncbi:MAG: ornithine cyclodeaminase family protein [Candidatus Promineifilaceae bacterium]|jgi:alanine dehydrogenase